MIHRPVKKSMFCRPTAAAGLALLLTITAPTSFAAPEAGAYTYGVFYGDRRIGEHEFAIQRSAKGLEVRSAASMEVRVLFVPVYRYRHEADELWQSRCLVELSSETNDNGTRYAVEASARSGALAIERIAPERVEKALPQQSCPATFAYWDLDLLRREHLLNAQTGRLAQVTLTAEGADSVGGTPAHRYLLKAEGLDPIHLWYRKSDYLWLRLETRRNGETLSYQLERQRPSAQYADAS